MRDKGLLNAEKLTKLWADGDLNLGSIYAYLVHNLNALDHMSTKALEHVADMCFALYEWSTMRRPLGDFLTAVVENDLNEAVLRADDVNRQQLWIYTLFTYNVAPTGWKERKNEKDT